MVGVRGRRFHIFESPNKEKTSVSVLACPPNTRLNRLFWETQLTSFYLLNFLSRPHKISIRCYLHNPHLPNCAEIQLWSSLVVSVNNALGNLCFGAVGDDQQHVCSEWTDAMSSFLGLQMSVCGHWFKANSLFSLGALWSHILLRWLMEKGWCLDGICCLSFASRHIPAMFLSDDTTGEMQASNNLPLNWFIGGVFKQLHIIIYIQSHLKNKLKVSPWARIL